MEFNFESEFDPFFSLFLSFHFFFLSCLADLVKRLADYEVVVPRKVSEQGQLLSHHLTHHYDGASRRQRRRRRQVDDGDGDDVHYRLDLSGRERQLHLKPNDRLLASAFVVERRQGRNVTNHRLAPARHKQCHYIGRVKGHPESTVAVSTCNGLVSGKLHFFRSKHNPPSTSSSSENTRKILFECAKVEKVNKTHTHTHTGSLAIKLTRFVNSSLHRIDSGWTGQFNQA
jgi:hypothetical protein